WYNIARSDLGRHAAGHQLQNAALALWRAFINHPLLQLAESIDGRLAHGLFDLTRHRVFFDLLAEFAPHPDGLVAVAFEERATCARTDAERAVQMARDELPSQSGYFERVKTPERLRRRVERGQDGAARQGRQIFDSERPQVADEHRTLPPPLEIEPARAPVEMPFKRGFNRAIKTQESLEQPPVILERR